MVAPERTRPSVAPASAIGGNALPRNVGGPGVPVDYQFPLILVIRESCTSSLEIVSWAISGSPKTHNHPIEA